MFIQTMDKRNCRRDVPGFPEAGSRRFPPAVFDSFASLAQSILMIPFNKHLSKTKRLLRKSYLSIFAVSYNCFFAFLCTICENIY